MADDDVRVPAGWYPDPLGLPQLRWWDNHAWTEHTSDARQPMMATETVVSARLAFKDDDEELEAAADELPTRRQMREQEQDAQGGSGIVDADLPNADALLSLEAPAKQDRDLEQPSPAARLASTGLSDDAPTSAPYRLNERHDDLLGESKPWSFDDPDGADEPYGYAGDPTGHSYYSPHDQYGYRGDPYQRPEFGRPQEGAGRRDDYRVPKYGSQPRTTSYAETEGQPASYSFWADPYARPNPYAPAEPVEQQAQPFPQQPAQQAPAQFFAPTPQAQPNQQPAPTFNLGQPPAGSAVPMYTPAYAAAEGLPDLQAVSYPTRRGTLTPVTLSVSTGPIWVMALLPVIMLVLGLLFLLSGGAGKLSSMFAAVILIGPYLIAIGLAIADRTSLQRMGYEHTAHWAWAILGAPAYLIVRLANVVRETGRGFGPLLTWVSTTLVAAVAVIAIPGILIALAPATFSAEAETAIQAEAASRSGAVLTVDCPAVPPLLIQQSMECRAYNDTQMFDVTVVLQRSNGWIDWRVANWGINQTNR